MFVQVDLHFADRNKPTVTSEDFSNVINYGRMFLPEGQRNSKFNFQFIDDQRTIDHHFNKAQNVVWRKGTHLIADYFYVVHYVRTKLMNIGPISYRSKN